MSDDEIKIVSTSNVTANMSPIIILDETTRTQVCFELQQIDNEKEPEQKLKGKFIYTVANKSTGSFEDIKRLNKKSIKAGESFELSLSCRETYLIWKQLTERYKLIEDKYTPYGEVTYVKKDEDYEKFKALLRDKKGLAQFLANADLNNINFALNVENLKRVKKEIENNIENSDEVKFWQPFFKNNAWVLSQIFNAPFMIMKDCNYVGGKSLSNKHGKFTDFIYQNKISKNISLIEIKTPTVSLTQETEYRTDVYSASKELSGALAQLLIQKDELYKEYANLRLNSDSYFDNDLFTCFVSEEQFYNEIDDKDFKIIDLSKYKIEQYAILKSNDGKVKGGGIDIVGDEKGYILNIKFYDKTVILDYESLGVSKTYSVGSAEIKYVTGYGESVYSTDAFAKYKNVAYQINYISLNDDCTEMFDELFS